MNEENPPKKGRKPKTEAGATVGIYLKPETYKKDKSDSRNNIFINVSNSTTGD